MNLLERFDQKQLQKIMEGKPLIPSFSAGDSLSVHVRIKEGEKERVQRFEGVCLGRHNAGLHSSFIVRRVVGSLGVERVFPLYSPTIEKIEVLRRGRVRRSKIYYLRHLTGKKARIAEKREKKASV